MRRIPWFLPALFAASVGCGDDDDGPPAAVVEPLEVRFEARVGNEPFACGSQYASIGADGATLTGPRPKARRASERGAAR